MAPAPTLLDGDGRIAFVTGATGGIGAACVAQLLASGASVVATGRRSVDIADHPKLLKLSLEVTDETQVQ